MRKTYVSVMISIVVASLICGGLNVWSSSPLTTMETPVITDASSLSMPPPVDWMRTYDGMERETTHSVIQTASGGYALTGNAFSGEQNRFWLVVTDSNGYMLWNRYYGDHGAAFSLVQTSDGGFAMAGVNNATGYMVRTDSVGNPMWTYQRGMVFYSVEKTSDGGYILGGTEMVGWPISTKQIMLVKLDWQGHEQWVKDFGGTNFGQDDYGHCAIQTSDGGYLIAGQSNTNTIGLSDATIVKTNSIGDQVWAQNFGGSEDEYFLTVIEATSGVFVAGGYTMSHGPEAGYNPWILKCNQPGTTVPTGRLSDAAHDMLLFGYFPHAIVKAIDGGYVIALDDGLAKVDERFNLVWTQRLDSFQGYGWYDSDVIISQDGKYVFAGTYYNSTTSNYDFALAKFSADVPQPPEEPAIVHTAASPTVGFVGTTFTVNVEIYNVAGLAGMSFDLTWNTSILQALSITEVLFHAITPTSDWSNIWNLSLKFNNTAGTATYAQTWQDTGMAQADGYAPWNGSHTVATMTFIGLALGTTDLTLLNVEVGDINARSIYHVVMSSSVTVTTPVYTPQMRVIPAEATIFGVGNQLTVNVTYEALSPAYYVVGYEFMLQWDPSILQCVSITEVAFHAAAPPSEWPNIWNLGLRLNNTAGTAYYAQTWQDSSRAIELGYAYISGNGTWATLTFNCTGPGDTFLNLTRSNLGDSSAQPVFNEAHGGLAKVNVPTSSWAFSVAHQWTDPPKLDVYTILLQSNCTGIAGIGFDNNSDYIYFVPLAAWNSFYNITLPKNLTSGALKVVSDGTILPSTVDWNVTHYFIFFRCQSATQIEIFGERSLPIPGDINDDGTVDIYDAIALAGKYGWTS